MRSKSNMNTVKNLKSNERAANKLRKVKSISKKIVRCSNDGNQPRENWTKVYVMGSM